jgi:hypothetical protein
MRNKLIIVIILFFSLFAFPVLGQKELNSPYSRFNIGTLQPEGAFRSLGMGGTGIGMRDNSSVYYTNPASYSSFDTVSFIFDFGLDYGRNFLSNGSTKYSSDDINFHHLIMAFPISKGFGFSVGIVPMSSGFYQVTQTITSRDPGYDPNVGPYQALHTGNGSISKYFFGTGLKLTKNFSAGINMIILSGQLNRANEFLLADSYSVFHSSNTESFLLTGINFEYGLQYSAILNKKYFINIGASYTQQHSYKTDYNQLSKKYTLYGSSDTISYIADKTPTFIPGTLRLGLSFGQKNKFTAGFDFITTKWAESIIPGSTGYAANTTEMKAGLEFIPEKYSNYSYLRRVEYRLGGHIGNNYLIINNEQIKEYGVSIGLGLPMRKTLSKTNLFLDFTKKAGSAENNLHNENYLSVGLSLNLYDYWFLKKKYD